MTIWLGSAPRQSGGGGQGSNLATQAGLVERALETRLPGELPHPGPGTTSSPPREGERKGHRLSFPKLTKKERCRASFHPSTGVMRCAGTTVTFPEAQHHPPHETTEVLASSRRRARASSPPPCPDHPALLGRRR
jgi:hypothetical protein